MRNNSSDKLKRACNIIKTDRMGVSSGIEKTVAHEVELTLSDFFALIGQTQVNIAATENGFEIYIKAKAKSVKQFRIIG